MNKFRRIVNTAGPFFGLLLVLFLFALDSDVRPFLFTGANFKIILIQTVIVAWVAITIALGPAVGAILRHQSRYYPPVR